MTIFIDLIIYRCSHHFWMPSSFHWTPDSNFILMKLILMDWLIFPFIKIMIHEFDIREDYLVSSWTTEEAFRNGLSSKLPSTFHANSATDLTLCVACEQCRYCLLINNTHWCYFQLLTDWDRRAISLFMENDVATYLSTQCPCRAPSRELNQWMY